jgi:transposase
VYEAGPCGYWLHRQLEAIGVSNHVVAPTAMNGRRKCDKRDAGTLRQQLREYVEGNKRAFSVVRVPTPQQEQERAQLRHRGRLVKALRRAEQQGRSLMLLHGMRVQGPWWTQRRWSELQPEVPAWMCELLADFQAEAQLAHEHIRAAEAKIQQLAQTKGVQAPRGIGALTWLTLLLEVGDWHRFKNRREVGSYTGLCGSEASSGDHRREGPIDRRGNPRVRHALIEAVWRLLRWQPGYQPLQRIVSAKSGRARRRAVVAAARRLAIDLWRLATRRTTTTLVHLDATA